MCWVSSAIAVAAALICFAGPARAETWWTAWEGDTYPEQDSWERIIYAGGAQRSLSDSCMTLDGRANIAISDFYRLRRSLVLASGEALMVTWRLRVDEVPTLEDLGISVVSQGNGAITLIYGENNIYSLFEGVSIPFTAGEFHDYQLTSSNLSSYALYIDGALAFLGQFAAPGWQSGVEWGDCGQGATGLATWDYFRFGVVAEPATSLLLGSVGLAGFVFRTRRSRSRCNGIM